MQTKLYHNPSDTTLTVAPNESGQFLFVFDQSMEACTISVDIEEHSNAQIFVWIIGNDDWNIPLTIRIQHKGPGSNGSARVRSILRDNSRNTFTGNVVIPKGVKDVESYLEYRAMLFDHARATATPALEIEEHPLKAGHAAAIGRVDEDQLFYLQTRGLSETQAIELVTNGFFAELVEAVSNEQKKEEVRNLLSLSIDQSAG